LVQSSHGNIPFEEFSFETIRHLSIEPGMDQDFYDKEDVQAVSERLLESVQAVHKRRVDTLVSQSWPIIKQVYETQSATYDNIAIPVSDGSKMMQVLVNLKKAYETQGREIARSLNKSITLMMIDEYWKEHLREMDDLKQSVQNASYEQKDPLLIYKFESFKLFQTMLDKVNRDVLGFLLKAHIPLRDVQSDPAKLRQEQRRKTDLSNMQTSRTDLVTSSGEPKSQGPVHVEKKVGRNDPCPCGSGKKYKNCHGAAN
jgi:preprotein translocase subunit SecA